MIKKSKKSSKNGKRNIIIYSVSTVAIILIISLLIFIIIPSINNSIRKNRIISIYNSLNLDKQKYMIQSVSVFGNKRTYEWDAGRSYSSSIRYVRSADVKTTVAEIKQAITKTKFSFYEEPYPGGANFMYIYKSPNNEYLRVSVSSKVRDDDIFNKFHMGTANDNITTDANTGPSNVEIKVNLDDNNE